jgi:hydroxymethylpyrimidine kinase/phosphomethylpyrimidine kinase
MKSKTDKNPKRPAVLTIAGIDPTAGAGILADVSLIRALGCHPLGVLTTVTAQTAREVSQIRALPDAFVREEMKVVLEEFKIQAIKIGMIYNPDTVHVIADALEEYTGPIVLDPIVRATSGRGLVRSFALPLIEKRLMQYCSLVTPNLDEAVVFTDRKIRTLEDMEQAALTLSHRWDAPVLVKGGHVEGDPVDVLAEKGKITRFKHPRLAEGTILRGTGCALSTAIACALAKKMPLVKAVKFGIDYLQEAIEARYTTATDPDVGFLNYPNREAL